MCTCTHMHAMLFIKFPKINIANPRISRSIVEIEIHTNIQHINNGRKKMINDL